MKRLTKSSYPSIALRMGMRDMAFGEPETSSRELGEVSGLRAVRGLVLPSS